MCGLTLTSGNERCGRSPFGAAGAGDRFLETNRVGVC